ncbi:hypothetical protein APA_1558 [Pseudanabaena sp. lw0831]|nr:hypothetical protein APA_1558 [Pseudanabaena sp. lw0831]
MIRGDRCLILRFRRSGFMGGERGDRWLMLENWRSGVGC